MEVPVVMLVTVIGNGGGCPSSSFNARGIVNGA